MTYTFKLSRRLARLRAPLFAALTLALATLLTGCDKTDPFTRDGSTPPEAEPATSPAGDPALAAVSFAGGIPIGTAGQPASAFGERFNGAQRYLWPEHLLGELAAIKARGGKVALNLAGPERSYKDADNRFVLSKWKDRVDLYKGVDFSAYINDGTIIGHYLIDEPNSTIPSNWNGEPIPGATLEEMARYSKQLWPNLPTIVRVEPGYLRTSGVSYRYLDAA